MPLDWELVESCPDLDRVEMVIESLPDERFMRKVESRRWGRKDATPVRMKCGIGKCGGRNIGSKYVCKDGPVFTWKELQALPAEY